jgi:hypothetical protein
VLSFLPNLILGQIFNDNCNGSILPEIDMGLPQTFNPNQLNIESIQLPYPILTYPADSNEIYVIGGQPFTLDLFVDQILTGTSGAFDLIYYSQFSPYIVKINPFSLDTMYLDLLGGPGIPYVGGVVAHPNGFIYAIAEARLFKIDPANMSIVSFADLPLLSPFSIYNGINVASNGNLITKSFILNDYTNGDFLMIDPNNLQTIDQINTQVGTARINFACDSLGNEYIHHINQDYTYRIKITTDSLLIDPSWQASYTPYNAPNNTEPTSPRMLNNHVIYTTNTTPNSTEPMKLFWQDKNLSYDLNLDTLESFFMFSDTVSRGLSFFGLTTDEESGIFIGIDQINGRIAAYSIDDSNLLEYLWERSYGVTSIPAIENSTGLVYINDFDQTQNVDYIVILDLFSGIELGRIATPGTIPSISNLVAGAYNDIYYCSNETGESLGYFHRVSLPTITSTEDVSHSVGKTIGNYPNPFSFYTTIEFEVSKNTTIQIDIYNSLGQHIERIINRNFSQGRHEVVFDGSTYENGLYFYRISSQNDSKTASMIIYK